MEEEGGGQGLVEGVVEGVVEGGIEGYLYINVLSGLEAAKGFMNDCS